MGTRMKEHEKLGAFMALGFAVLILALLAYFVPPEEGTGAQRIIDAAMGGLLLALGSAANALFRIREESDKTVTVDNPPSKPVPVAEPPTVAASGELPETEKLP